MCRKKVVQTFIQPVFKRLYVGSQIIKATLGVLMLGSALVTLISCQHYSPVVGALVIDPTLPPLHNERLPIGVALDMVGTDRDLLSPNLLLNSNLELAPALPNCAFNFADSTLTTPNGYKTFYPLQPLHYGWDVIQGHAEVQREQGLQHSLSFLRLCATPDSLHNITVRQRIRSYVSRDKDSLWFSCKLRSKLEATSVAILLTDSLGRACSNKLTFNTTNEWSLQTGLLVVDSSVQKSYLTLSVASASCLDVTQLSLQQVGPSLTEQLTRYLAPLQLEYIRYPSGQVANGYYPNTYPIPLQKPTSQWYLTQREGTGSFQYLELLTLCENLGAHPIYIVNVGITSPEAMPRSEDITELPARIEKVAALAKKMLRSSHKTSKGPIIQLGYNMSSQDYFRRFQAFRKVLQSDTLNIDLISGADLSSSAPFSDIIYDVAGVKISYPELQNYLPFGDNPAAYIRQPIMLGQVQFEHCSTPHYLPDLLQRGIFLIQAEQKAMLLKGVSMNPLLASADGNSLGVFTVNGSKLQPTNLYWLLKDFIQCRGDLLRQGEQNLESDAVHHSPLLYTSLTSLKGDSLYYLKAANATRHPLTYRWNVSSLNASSCKISVIRYRLRQRLESISPNPQYLREEQELPISKLTGLSYTFSPYEWAVFKIEVLKE